jgi:general secretion pathway protein D
MHIWFLRWDGENMVRRATLFVLLLLSISVGGCPKARTTNSDYQKGRAAQAAGDSDAAVEYFEKASLAERSNAQYKISLNRARFQASENHVRAGIRLRENGKLDEALREFQSAITRDPSNPLAFEELEKTRLQLAPVETRSPSTTGSAHRKPGSLAQLPPELKPLSTAPINLRMTNDSKVIFETIGQLSGLSIIFDPDFVSRRVSVELNNVTAKQAMDVACLESKGFWKPVTENIVIVVPDQTQKRRDFDEEVMRTFYLSNVVQAQDLTEITTGLRQLLDLKHVQQLNAQNAITIRDTPSKIALANKFINDIDNAKPEVVVDVAILQTSTDRLRTLGILPGQSASISINPNASSSSSSSSSSSTSSNSSTLQQLAHLNGSDYSVTLPDLTANAVLTDSDTKIIQNPEIRMVDGIIAKLKVGDRVPVATGSYSAGTSVTSTSSLSSLVSTQFQYIDVGVNLDVTPRIHPNNEVSLKVSIEVSSVTSYTTIGGISEPVISQRKIEHDIRLKEGEANILGGLFQRTDTKSLNGWPGLAKIPLLRYLFSEDSKEIQESDVLIILTPHIIRNHEWTAESLQSVFTGTETNIEVYPENALRTPTQELGNKTGDDALQTTVPPRVAFPSDAPAPNKTEPSQPLAELKISPASFSVKPGEIQSASITVVGVADLFSIPLLVKYDPAVIQIQDVQNGGFLSGESQEIAIIERNDTERGEMLISAVRSPQTAGIGGSGTLFKLTIKAVAPGRSQISIVQVNAKDSQQKNIPVVTHEATILVQR